eukprot:m.61333 g.61333  ORF g.61333 m.61333 type:complete len:65 (+) comp7331_c0_seq4:248-442(+)
MAAAALRGALRALSSSSSLRLSAQSWMSPSLKRVQAGPLEIGVFPMFDDNYGWSPGHPQLHCEG